MVKNLINKSVWITFGLGALILLTVIVIGSVISIAEELGRMHPYAEIGFYIFIVLALYLLVIQPLLSVLIVPVIAINELAEEKVDPARCRQIAKYLLKRGNLKGDEKAQLKIAWDRGSGLLDPLQKILSQRMERIDVVIRQHAVLAFVSTAISQSGRLDGIAVLIANLRMMRAITRECGFRPALPELAKMYVRVLIAGIVATALEEFDQLEELFLELGMNVLGEIPFLSVIVSSLLQGFANALLTLRIGYLTKSYMLAAGRGFQPTSARIAANKEARSKILPVTKEATALLPGYLKNAADQILPFGEQ